MLRKCEEGTSSLLQDKLSAITSRLEAIEDNKECEARFLDAINKLDSVAEENLRLKGRVDHVKSLVLIATLTWYNFQEIDDLKTNQLDACEEDVAHLKVDVLQRDLEVDS